MRISTSKSESMVLARKKVECLLRVGEEVLPQVEEFKYLGILFMSEGRMEREINRRIGAASAVVRALNRSIVVKKKLSRKAKLSIYRSIYVPVLTYGHQRWVMTERMRSRIQATEMSFLHRVAGLSLRDRVRSPDIREELGIEPLLLYIERSQLGWLRHLARMPSGSLPLERLGVPPEELMEVAGNHMLLRVLPSVYPRQPEAIHCHLHSLLAMMLQLESPEQQHLIHLIQAVAEKHPVILSPQVPRLVSYLEYQCLSEALLGALVDVSQASPSSLFGLLPALRIVGQQFPALLGHVAKIHGSVGVISKTRSVFPEDESLHRPGALNTRSCQDYRQPVWL
ncbi:Ventricular zone-expressed PH domain-containing protein [Takifugu flavidus]|uniref:Ventricular zone-expressed PH domain-containing protein n=1 Tax=Takifugu flavidus TaxID=433684 RepID=A0A5C6PEQ1_9TELE|nr:Ventricular zone-expressed PH domain-containing protein [Takifugu flavidus]